MMMSSLTSHASHTRRTATSKALLAAKAAALLAETTS